VYEFTLEATNLKARKWKRGALDWVWPARRHLHQPWLVLCSRWERAHRTNSGVADCSGAERLRRFARIH